jgi:redox-sensitive bicupin YhaK (pirin superfamily)
VTVHQDAVVYATLLDPGQSATHEFRPGFNGYLFAVHGTAKIATATDTDAGEVDEAGAAKVEDEPRLTVRAGTDGAELLLVETRAETGRSIDD